jgi:hypothetical protein
LWLAAVAIGSGGGFNAGVNRTQISTMTRWPGGVLALALLAVVGAPAYADEPWEGHPLTAAQRDACRTLPRALVRAVTPSHRGEAAALLGSERAVVLDDARAGDWIGVPAPQGVVLSDRLLHDALIVTLDRIADSFGEHAPKFSPTEQAMYANLLQVVNAPHPVLKPVLVRAVAGDETTGAFDAADCGGAVAVRHLSGGAPEEKPEPVPVIVFLAAPPSGVQAWREAGR